MSAQPFSALTPVQKLETLRDDLNQALEAYSHWIGHCGMRPNYLEEMKRLSEEVETAREFYLEARKRFGQNYLTRFE
jgi:hypothetical protein